MKADDTLPLFRAFAAPLTRLVKLTPEGFLIRDEGGEEVCPELSGRLRKMQLLRKRFEDHLLVCQSADGATADDGTACEGCLHPRCRPQLRIHLAEGPAVYVIDLNVTSARNLLALQEQAEAAGGALEDWTLRAAVVPRGYWGEVRFTRA